MGHHNIIIRYINSFFVFIFKVEKTNFKDKTHKTGNSVPNTVRNIQKLQYVHLLGDATVQPWSNWYTKTFTWVFIIRSMIYVLTFSLLKAITYVIICTIFYWSVYFGHILLQIQIDNIHIQWHTYIHSVSQILLSWSL